MVEESRGREVVNLRGEEEEEERQEVHVQVWRRVVSDHFEVGRRRREAAFRNSIGDDLTNWSIPLRRGIGREGGSRGQLSSSSSR